MCDDCSSGYFRRGQTCASCDNAVFGSRTGAIAAISVVWLMLGLGALLLPQKLVGGVIWMGLMLQTLRAAALMCISDNWIPPLRIQSALELLGVFGLDYEIFAPGCEGDVVGTAARRGAEAMLPFGGASTAASDIAAEIESNGWLIVACGAAWLLLCVGHLLVQFVVKAVAAPQHSPMELLKDQVPRYLLVCSAWWTLAVYPVSELAAKSLLCEDIEVYEVKDWMRKWSSRFKVGLLFGCRLVSAVQTRNRRMGVLA